MTDLDSQQAAQHASRKAAQPDAAALMAKLLWSVPETAFMCRVAARTVWRLMSDPRAKFPKARRVRGRTLLARDEVLEFMKLNGGAAG
jgi:predicted DNA-binding transcriptional regulator AlpA